MRIYQILLGLCFVGTAFIFFLQSQTSFEDEFYVEQPEYASFETPQPASNPIFSPRSLRVEQVTTSLDDNQKTMPYFFYYENVIIGSEEDFDRILGHFDYVLVEFYARWCKYCIKLHPEFLKAAQILAESRPNVALCMVDTPWNPALKVKYRIRRYPTIVMFSKKTGKKTLYRGRRNAQAIVKYIDEQIQGIKSVPVVKKPKQKTQITPKK